MKKPILDFSSEMKKISPADELLMWENTLRHNLMRTLKSYLRKKDMSFGDIEIKETPFEDDHIMSLKFEIYEK